MKKPTTHQGKFTKNCVVCGVKMEKVTYNTKYCVDHKKDYYNMSYGTNYGLLKKVYG